MRVYETADGLQLWTFPSGYIPTRRKSRCFLLWDYTAERGYKFMTRKEAASFLRSFRRMLSKVLDQ